MIKNNPDERQKNFVRSHDFNCCRTMKKLLFLFAIYNCMEEKERKECERNLIKSNLEELSGQSFRSIEGKYFVQNKFYRSHLNTGIFPKYLKFM